MSSGRIELSLWMPLASRNNRLSCHYQYHYLGRRFDDLQAVIGGAEMPAVIRHDLRFELRIRDARLYLVIDNLLDDPQEAVALCEKALAIDAQCDDAWNVAGLAYLDSGDRDNAVECFTSAITANADNAFALNNLGLTYIYMERFDKALLPLEQAVEIAPGIAFMRNNLGIVYENLGRTAEAAHQYAAAVDTPSGHDKAQANLKRILPMLSVEEEARLAEFYQVDR